MKKLIPLACMFFAHGVTNASDGSSETREYLEETLIIGQHDSRTIDLVDTLSVAPDPARLLYRAPGANVVTNGPLTGIPQLRGLHGARIAVTLDNTFLAPAGPNWMDPPLSYAVTAQLEALKVYRGIAPVSVAQESLGGVITAETRRMAFTDSPDWDFAGRVQANARSVSDGYQFDADIQLANRERRFRLTGMVQSGEDARFPDGRLRPTSYERARYDVGYGQRWGDHSLQVDVGHTHTGETGTPALPMDIDYFRGDLIDVTYRYQPSEGITISATLFASDLDHGMSNYQLRPAPTSPGRWRRNTATTENRGFRIQLEGAPAGVTWRMGLDGFSEAHQSDIDNPNNANFFVTNFNDATRRVIGGYVEQDLKVVDGVTAEWGARLNQIRSDAARVDGMPARMMPPAASLRDRFNNAERSITDTVFDVYGKTYWGLSEGLDLYLGVAHKQRAPSYQERYLWLALEATAGLADGQLYVGNVALKPETAWQMEWGADYRSGNFSIKPRVFYQRIDDYIQGAPLAGDDSAVMFVRMANTMNGTNRADPLQFANVAARIYGADMDWSWQIDAQWALSGVVSWVRGKRDDIADDLYRIAPPNASVQLEYRVRDWGMSAEWILYSGQDNVSTTNREQVTGGYGVMNMAAEWRASPSMSLVLGVENLLDRQYAPHLGGYNRAFNPDVGTLQRLPAPGANAFARLRYQF